MGSGLDKILAKIKEDPTRQILHSRYLVLIADLPDVEEKKQRTLDLAKVYLASNQTEALKLAYMVYQVDKSNIPCLELMAECFDLMGKTDKAAMIRRERDSAVKARDALVRDKPRDPRSKRSVNMQTAQSPQFIPAPILPSATTSQEVTGHQEETASEDNGSLLELEQSGNAQVFSFRESFGMDSSEKGRINNSSELSMVQSINISTEESSTEGSLHQDDIVTAFLNDVATQEPIPSLSEENSAQISQESSEGHDSNEFNQSYIPSHGYHPKGEGAVELNIDIPANEDIDAALDSLFAESAPIPDQLEDWDGGVNFDRELFKADSEPAQVPATSPLMTLDPVVAPTFAIASQQPQINFREHIPSRGVQAITEAAEVEEKKVAPSPHGGEQISQYPGSRIPSLTSDKASAALPRPLEAIEFWDSIGIELTKAAKTFKIGISSYSPPLFKDELSDHLIFDRLYEQRETLVGGKDTIWELTQALWGCDPGPSGAIFLRKLGLTRQTVGFWGIYLDCLIASGHFRKAKFEVYQVLKTVRSLEWGRIAWRRIPAIYKGMQWKAIDWTEDEGIHSLLEKLGQRPSVTFTELNWSVAGPSMDR